MKSANIWIIDDDRSIRWVLEKALEQAEFKPRTFDSGEGILNRLQREQPDAIISDIRMPGIDGLDLLNEIHAQYPELPVIIMTAHSDLDSAVSSYQRGAFDYLPKPFDVDDAVLLAQRAVAHSQEQKAQRQQSAQEDLRKTTEIIGEAPAMQEVFRAIGRLSQSNITVLINGESGTGKELVARALHQHSPRRANTFIALNMAAIPRDLIESELFGHEKGSFTGAANQRVGRFELADGGTLFLDEIGDISPSLQVKLLRVLQEREFERVGGMKTIKVDVRLVAATNRDLEAAVAAGRFRHDLYYRLQVIQITMPPLRQRKEDLPALVNHFITRFARENDRKVTGVSDEVMEIFLRHSWPGNVRELENCLEYATVMAEPDATLITPDVLPLSVRTLAARGDTIHVPAGTTFEEAMAVVERELLLEALKKSDWDLRAAARALAMSDRSLEHYVEKHGLQSRDDWMPELPAAGPKAR